MSIKNPNILSILILGLLFSASSNAQSKEPSEEKTKTETNQIDHKKHKSDENKPWNEVCPVRGGKVNANVVTVEYKDKEYGFCCGGCDTKFKKDPEKYSRNLSEDGKKFLGKKS